MINVNVAINENWFNEIKDLIEYENDYHYIFAGVATVEVDVNKDDFEAVSKELGWM